MKNNIRELRKKANMSQSELATKLNVTRQYISKLETGNHILSLALANEIANQLEVSIYDVFDLSSSKYLSFVQ
nr:helix-turn-helix transcriptional regulator [uncultured Blautia sp.]